MLLAGQSHEASPSGLTSKIYSNSWKNTSVKAAHFPMAPAGSAAKPQPKRVIQLKRRSFGHFAGPIELVAHPLRLVPAEPEPRLVGHYSQRPFPRRHAVTPGEVIRIGNCVGAPCHGLGRGRHREMPSTASRDIEWPRQPRPKCSLVPASPLCPDSCRTGRG